MGLERGGAKGTVPVQIKVHCWSAGACLDSEIFICMHSVRGLGLVTPMDLRGNYLVTPGKLKDRM